ncbi:hypothetical protein [Lederbergia citri]|uniref:Uncharacterized protein n=1 Tax=Lederbergia citri TaxID=2833580 RepID=A0A942TBY1_9BACI|nr:hypothetical protein [Lederbergia citri]MBS4193492.1 hypothetical protein [Lederbergia citri]
MNNLNDVKEIVENYYLKGGQILGNARELSAANEAEQLWQEGLSKLDALKLSRSERRNFRFLQDSFKLAIKSAQALQKGQFDKAELLSEQLAKSAFRYARKVKSNG